jgi:hypothetical protein
MREDSSLSLFGRITSELVGKLPLSSSQTGLVTDAGIFVLQIEIGCLQYQRQQQNGGENKSHRQVIVFSGKTGIRRMSGDGPCRDVLKIAAGFATSR